MTAEGVPDPEVEALLEGLGKAGARNECPVCGHGRWKTLQTLGEVPFAHEDGDGVAALGLACARCGFVRLHAAQVLDQYMDPRGD